MPWNYDTSLDRVQKHLDIMGEIEVLPYTREMDLDGLSETRCRDIFGAHVYAEIRNLSTLVSERTTKSERQELIQATHIYQREVARITDKVGAERIVFQGARAHLLVHHPVADAAGIAKTAVLLQMILDRFGVVFNTEFDNLADAEIRSGADMGNAIGTRNGTSGDRELLFIGPAANHAAKLLAADTAPRRLTKAIAEVLPDDLATYVLEDGDTLKLSRPTDSALADLLTKYKIDWTSDGCAERLAGDRDLFPAASAGLWGTEEKIDFDALSYSTSRLVAAATLFGDVAGFTAYVDSAETDDEKSDALRALHAIRKEMAEVVKKDGPGVRVQYQGDRIEAIYSLPADDSAGVSDAAVRAAVALQSSFEKVLKKLLPQIAGLGLAVGVSRGDTIAARLGERAHRDRILLGDDVLRAERNEERVTKNQIGISKNVRDHLSTELADEFEWDAASGCYVATGLDQDKLDLAEAAKAVAAGNPLYIAGTTITAVPTIGRAIRPAASHGPR
jgi:hypothetical protein